MSQLELSNLSYEPLNTILRVVTESFSDIDLSLVSGKLVGMEDISCLAIGC